MSVKVRVSIPFKKILMEVRNKKYVYQMNIFQEIFVDADPKTAKLLSCSENVSPNVCVEGIKVEKKKLKEHKKINSRKNKTKNMIDIEHPGSRSKQSNNDDTTKKESQVSSNEKSSFLKSLSTVKRHVRHENTKSATDRINEKNCLANKISELEKQLESILEEKAALIETNDNLQKSIFDKKKILAKKEKEANDFECEYQDRLQEIEEQNEFRYRELLTRGSSLH